MHLYTLVAAPFVAELLGLAATTDPRVGRHASIIQAAFLVGWALGGIGGVIYWVAGVGYLRELLRTNPSSATRPTVL
jgi:hypothetical protein